LAIPIEIKCLRDILGNRSNRQYIHISKSNFFSRIKIFIANVATTEDGGLVVSSQ